MMLRRSIQNVLATLTSASMLMMTACGDNAAAPPPADEPPDIPPSSTMVIDFNDFLDSVRNGQQGVLPFANWLRGAGTVGVWSVIITATLAVPVAAFVESFDQPPQRLGGDAWSWPYDVTVAGIAYSARLEARTVDAGIEWQMFVTSPGQYDDFQWFTGVSNITNTAGTWTLNKDPQDPSAFIFIEWSRDPDGVAAEVKYTNITPDDPTNGSYITSGLTETEPHDAFYDLFGAGEDRLIRIEWNRESKVGRIMDASHFGDADWHCWDEELLDVPCAENVEAGEPEQSVVKVGLEAIEKVPAPRNPKQAMSKTIDTSNPIVRLREGISTAIKQARYRSRNRRTRTFIVSFPKTGRTWLRVMLGRALVELGHGPEDLLLDTYRISRGLPHGPVRFSHGGPLYLLDHSPFDLLRFDHELYSGKRVVHLVRDVRDSLVSYYFQVSKREKVFAGDMGAFLRDPRYGARKIVRFYTLWFQEQQAPSAFLLKRYEDLHRDAAGELTDLLRFLGLGGDLAGAARSAVAFASFENMRKLETRQTFDRAMMKPGDPHDKESFKTRKGQVGGYEAYLDEDDLRYIDEVIAELGDPACTWYCHTA